MKKRIVVVQGTLQMLVAVSALNFIKDRESGSSEDYLLVGSLYSNDEMFANAVLDSGKIWNWKKVLRLPVELEKKWEVAKPHEKSEILNTVRHLLEVDNVDECICSRTTQPANEIGTCLNDNLKVSIYGDGLGGVDGWFYNCKHCKKPDISYLLLPHEEHFGILKKLPYYVIPKDYFVKAIDQYIKMSDFFKFCYDFISQNHIQLMAKNSMLFLSTWSIITPSLEYYLSMHYESLKPFLDSHKTIFIKSHIREDRQIHEALLKKLESHSISVFDLCSIPYLQYIPVEVILKVLSFEKVFTFLSSSCISLNWLYGTNVILGKRDNIQPFLNDYFKKEPDPIHIFSSILKKLPTWDNKTPLYTYPLSQFLRKKIIEKLNYYYFLVKKNIKLIAKKLHLNNINRVFFQVPK